MNYQPSNPGLPALTCSCLSIKSCRVLIPEVRYFPNKVFSNTNTHYYAIEDNYDFMLKRLISELSDENQLFLGLEKFC
jgi:hypothetical protein